MHIICFFCHSLCTCFPLETKHFQCFSSNAVKPNQSLFRRTFSKNKHAVNSSSRLSMTYNPIISAYNTAMHTKAKKKKKESTIIDRWLT